MSDGQTIRRPAIAGVVFPDGGYVPAQMLHEGKRYVFTTEYDERERWHDLRVSPFSWMTLSEVQPDSAPEVRGRFACPSNPNVPSASRDR